MQRTTTLAAAPTSARAARRFVGETLAAWRLAEMAETAELLVSELVTNVVLHAHTEIEVMACAERGTVRIEVRDTSSVLPTTGGHHRDSQTGRGLELIELLSDAWGVEVLRDRHGLDGKGVWFELSVSHPSSYVEHSAPGVGPPGWAMPVTPVCLKGVPTALYRASEEHRQGLTREFVLMTLDDVAAPDVPARLVALSEEVSQRFSRESAFALDQVQTAERRGDITVDLRVEMTPAAAAALAAMVDVLEEADLYCQQGVMLTVAASAEIRAFRRWCVEEVAAQLDGQPGTPWKTR